MSKDVWEGHVSVASSGRLHAQVARLGGHEGNRDGISAFEARGAGPGLDRASVAAHIHLTLHRTPHCGYAPRTVARHNKGAL
jgi:hypothetical protein